MHGKLPRSRAVAQVSREPGFFPVPPRKAQQDSPGGAGQGWRALSKQARQAASTRRPSGRKSGRQEDQLEEQPPGARPNARVYLFDRPGPVNDNHRIAGHVRREVAIELRERAL